MFGLGALIVGGLVLLGGRIVLEAMEEEARDAQRRWRNNSERLQKDVERHNREVKRHLTSNKQSLEFEQLRQLHYESHQKARAVYGILQDNRKVREELSRLLCQSAKQRDTLKQRITNLSGNQKFEAKKELGLLFAHRNQCFNALEKSKEEGEKLLESVRTMNAQTRHLKLQIRDNCGHGGALWYERLEARRLKPPAGCPRIS